MSAPRAKGVLFGNDALNMLIDIYLDGFTSGAATGVATMTQGKAGDNADRIAEWIVEGMLRDPLTIETIRNEIQERLTGTDSGPKSWTLPGDLS